MVLLVVDTQKLITTTDLYNFNAFENAVKTLIAAARENNVEVIYVRHDDGVGAELTKGTPGFEIYEGFSPRSGEKIFDKTVNSSFKGTGLLEYLKAKNVHTVAVVGLQTDYCIDATIKCGFEHSLLSFRISSTATIKIITNIVINTFNATLYSDTAFTSSVSII